MFKKNCKKTTSERVDFTLQLLMLVIFIIIFLSFFVSCCPRDFKLGQVERVQTMKAQINRPGKAALYYVVSFTF